MKIFREKMAKSSFQLRGGLLTGLLVVPLLLAGCSSPNALPSSDSVIEPSSSAGSSGGGSGSQSFLGPSALQKEYSAAVSAFPEVLPTGIKFPVKIPTQTPNIKSQVGVGASYASFYWLCAWEHVYIAANTTGNEESISTALGKIKLWTTLPWSKKYFDDSSNGWRDAVLTPATLGDPSGVQAQYQGDCGSYRESNG